MGTFIRAIIALLAAAFLGLGALLLVGIIATLAFSIRVFISVFKASKRTSHSSQRALRSSDKKPVPPHYYRDRAQRRKQREQENNDNAD